MIKVKAAYSNGNIALVERQDGGYNAYVAVENVHNFFAQDRSFAKADASLTRMEADAMLELATDIRKGNIR